MLHGGICTRLPLLLLVSVLQAKLSQNIQARYSIDKLCSSCRAFCLFYCPFHLFREVFAHVGAYSAPVYRLVGVPVWAVSYAFAASTATRFAAVADLLVVGDLAAIHLTSPID